MSDWDMVYKDELEFRDSKTNKNIVYQQMATIPRVGELIDLYDDIESKKKIARFEVVNVVYENVGYFEDCSYGVVVYVKINLS